VIAAVAGATGALGSEICRRLRERGLEVRELARPRFDLTRPATLRDGVAGADIVVSTATSFPREDGIERVDRDGNIALVDAAEAARATRFVFVSFRPVALDFPLQRAKRAVEERLARAALDAVVLRPGKFMDVWFSPLCGFDAEARRATIFGDGTNAVTWIARDDVAEFAARAALGELSGTIELGGPEALSPRAQELLRVTEEALFQGILQARPGNRLSDIGAAIEEHVNRHGMSVVRDFVGHGVGRNMHEAPQVHHHGPPGRGPLLREGMCLAIEPQVNLGSPAVRMLDDGWTAVTVDGSLSAHFEHTVAITNNGPEILTLAEDDQRARQLLVPAAGLH
jgi:uncharacterized protein YbjT (DUF2867 family)